MRSHGQRGQVLPLWVVAIMTTFVLMFLAINYGNTVRWQMRAQNAADGAAQALMAVQTQRYNELTAALYTANVEEFRVRLVLDGMLNALNGSGGCNGQPASGPKRIGQTAFSTASGTCDDVYHDLLPIYEAAVNRYTVDVARVNDIATKSTYSNWTSDIQKLLAHLSSTTRCNDVSITLAASVNPDGGDCQFKYTLNTFSNRVGLNAVSADAYIVFVPTQGFTLANNAETENPQLFQPGEIDIAVCAKVPPLIPGFGALSAKPHYVIGRAGATAVLTEEDWFQPGTLLDPVRGGNFQFQPPEHYTQADTIAGYTGYDWYGVNYGGNAWKIGSFPDPKIPNKTDYGYASAPVVNDMSAYVGWWNAIPFDPRKVTGAVNPVTATVCP